MKKVFFMLPLLFWLSISVNGQPEHHIYKETDTVALQLYLYRPAENRVDSLIPAVIFFFGGGWVGGTPKQFKPHCQFLASHGIVGIAAEYRVKNRHGTSPTDAIMDAKSALRWLKKNGMELGIDTSRILAAGGSAGGHLAAAIATIDDINDPSDDLAVSPMPAALILFNPVLNTEVLPDRFENQESAFKASPMNFVDKDIPPTLIFHGTDDSLVPYDSILEFQRKMQDTGNYCEVILFGGMGHGFFNKGKHDDRPYRRTLAIMKQFIDEFVL
jgi:acetyl esterase/lipase